MTPRQLTEEHFRAYPTEARAVALANLELFRGLPMSFVPLLLRELISYDRKFPAERAELTSQLAYLKTKPDLTAFEHITITPELEAFNWAQNPARFSELLSAHLWSTHQIENFRTASVEFIGKSAAHAAAVEPAHPRFVAVVIGHGADASRYALFRKLKPYGLHLTNLDPENGLTTLRSWVAARAAQQPEPYAHWNVDGGDAPALEGVTAISYAALALPRQAMSGVLRRSFESGMGAEALRTRLAAMSPAEIGLALQPSPVTAWFQLSLLSEGSGTQIFSTTFVQWTAREVLRRAQPSTLLCRYAPRRRANSMKDLLSEAPEAASFDPQGSLIDGDMAAYQTWLNVERLTGAKEARFFCWHEDKREALVIAPGVQKGTASAKPVTWETTGRELLGVAS